MNDSPNRDVEVFTTAVQLSAAERATYLDHVCVNDAELRREVSALLKFHDSAGDFLEQSPHGAAVETRLEASIGVKTGDRIGRYKLLQPIGEGGCGVVYLAEQQEPVRRRVALKVIKPGMDTKSVIARFEAERQALALMDHPNIAKVLDAGATESGRPYFVMELVQGVKITDYCDQNSLSTKERLKLFIQVCHAIQHAHQKGVIHRDIKPSNILVTTTAEGAALPVVIDFGIAKATANQRLTDKTFFTAFELLIGTPAYMSPEQAELTKIDVDTRTDIYSLGVLLYELLTGSTPFDMDALLKAGLDEIRRVIQEQEPVRPSTQLGKLTQENLTVIAKRHRSEPTSLIRAIRGDLDWIVMKALEKDRTRRYETANGFALDVQRFLADEAILARPPSALYKFRKTVSRNRLLFSSISSIALLLFVSLVVVSASLAKERLARVKSLEVTKFLEDMLNGVGPSVALGQDTTLLRGILDRTAERVGKEMTDQPAVEAELRSLIGRIYLEIGDYKQGEVMLRTALMINRKLFGVESKESASSLNDLGLALMEEHKLSEGEEVDLEALAIRRRLFGNENADTATSINDLGSLYREDGKLAESERLSREALEIRRQLFGSENLEVADSLRNLSIVLGDEGKWAESEDMAREVLAMRRKLHGSESLDVASTLNDIAWAAGARGKLDEAEKLEQESLVMREKLLGAENPDVAKSLYLVGDRTRQRGNLSEAASTLSAALSMQRKVLGEDNPNVLYTLNSLGLALESEGNWSEAETVRREELVAWRKIAGEEDPKTLNALEQLGSALEAQGKWSEAETVRREALAVYRKQKGNEDPQTLYALRRLGFALEGERKWSEVETLWRESLTVWRIQKGDEDNETLYTLDKLGSALEAQGKWPEAEPMRREALATWRKRAGDEDPTTVHTLAKLGTTLEAEGKWSEAEPVWREALAISRKRGGNEGPETLTDLEHLARVLVAQKKFDDAQQILDEVLTPALAKQKSGSDLVMTWVDIMGRRGRWQEATADATFLCQLQPADNYNYHRLAGLLAITHNRAAYEQICQKFLTKFANTTDPFVAARIAQDCLLLPHSGVDLSLLDQLADKAVTLRMYEDAMPYFQACKAMSNYRLGHFPGAIEWGEKATKSSTADAQAKAYAYAVLAMAHWQLGQKDIARAMLAKGDMLAPSILPGRDNEDIGESWVAWLFARISLDEATALIQGQLM
jgi:serine/threonine protein kinase